MKKKLLSLIVAVAMLFSVVTFVVQADTDGEGDYFYFDIEHFAEDTTKEIYMIQTDFMITAENLKLLKVNLRVQQTQ